MPYYIRVLGTKDLDIHVDELLAGLQEDGLKALITIEASSSPSTWTQLEVSSPSSDALMVVERNPVFPGQLGQEELQEFAESVDGARPANAAEWLKGYFEKVKVIYAFQLLDAAFEGENYAIVSSIRTNIWNRVGGILQADGEGFSNEDGYHILWEFSENVQGEWNMAVLSGSDQWTRFAMDLGDKDHRSAFMSGKIPSGVSPSQ
jgi:hypothetical protein